MINIKFQKHQNLKIANQKTSELIIYNTRNIKLDEYKSQKQQTSFISNPKNIKLKISNP